jgi:nucleoside-diphosphate-sugar epimerase
MNILITGAFGFVGANLSKALSAAFKHHLIAVDVSEPERHSYSEYIPWDKLHTPGNKKIDAIIHLAGKAHDTRNTAAEQDYFDINLGLTQKIFEFFLQSGAKKFIFFSSVKAAADTVPGQYLTEKTTPAPGTPYGRSKLAAENYLQQQLPSPGTLNSKPETRNPEPGTLNSEPATSSVSPGFQERSELKNVGRTNPAQRGNLQPATSNSLFILRPAMIHGPNNKGNLNLLYKVVSKGIPWPLGAFENRRSFTSIANLNFIVEQLLEKDIEPGIYNVADDEPLSINRLIELIAESHGKKARIWKFSPKQVSRLARLGDKLHLPLNSERLKKLTESYVVSNEKLKKALGIATLPVSAEEGMKETLKSFNNS